MSRRTGHQYPTRERRDSCEVVSLVWINKLGRPTPNARLPVLVASARRRCWTTNLRVEGGTRFFELDHVITSHYSSGCAAVGSKQARRSLSTCWPQEGLTPRHTEGGSITPVCAQRQRNTCSRYSNASILAGLPLCAPRAIALIAAPSGGVRHHFPVVPWARPGVDLGQQPRPSKESFFLPGARRSGRRGVQPHAGT